ncbi:unnamed protein product, partial [Sphacelaria rigidula]
MTGISLQKYPSLLCQQFVFVRPGHAHRTHESTVATAGSTMWCGFPGYADPALKGSKTVEARAPLHGYQLSNDQTQRFEPGFDHPVIHSSGTNRIQPNPLPSKERKSCSSAVSYASGADLLVRWRLLLRPFIGEHKNSKPHTRAPPNCSSARLTTLPSSAKTTVPGSLLFDERNYSLKDRNRKE